MNTNEICIFALPKECATEDYVDRMAIYAVHASPIEVTFVKNRRTKGTFNAIVNFGANHQITNSLEWLLDYEVRGKIQAIHHQPDKEDQPVENVWFDVRWAYTPVERANARLRQENARLKRANAGLKRANAGLKRANAGLKRANAGLKQENARLERAIHNV